jgi:twitching motility protein PilT
VLVPTPAIRHLIREAKTHQLMTTMQTGRQHGMCTMDESLAELYKRGHISYEMALAQSIDPAVVKTLLGRTEG